MIEDIMQLVEKACHDKKNRFGYSAWYHILSVTKYSKALARELGADEEVAEVAAVLHDYAAVLDSKKYYADHHIHGARLAEEILSGYNFPKEKIAKVKHCIISHRGSKKIKRNSLEAHILADADAMAHFDNVDSLLHLAFVQHKMDQLEGAHWVLGKLERSWAKMTPPARKIMKDKYLSIKDLFDHKGKIAPRKLSAKKQLLS